MVVLRSTTPWVAVNSRSNSTLLTVISMVPTATAASTGIDCILRLACYFYYFPYIKYKTYKTSSNSRRTAEVENFGNRPIVTTLGIIPSCEKSVPSAAETSQQDFRFCHFSGPLHSFHNPFTARKKEDRAAPWKTPNTPRLSAQLLGQLIEQPVQIFIVLANLFDLLHRVQHGRVMLSPKLPSNLRQRGLGHMFSEIHRDLPRIHDRPRIVLRLNLHQPQPKLLGHHLLDRLNRDLPRLRIDKILQHLLRVRQRNLRPNQRRVRHQPDQRSFQLAHVRPDILRHIQRHIGRQRDFLLLCFLLQDRHLRLQGRRLE